MVIQWSDEDEVFALPSAFTLATTRDHWDVLVRARAIEQQAFFVAANQVGEHRFPLAEHRVRAERRGDPGPDDREERAAVGDVEILGRPADRRRSQLDRPCRDEPAPHPHSRA